MARLWGNCIRARAHAHTFEEELGPNQLAPIRKRRGVARCGIPPHSASFAIEASQTRHCIGTAPAAAVALALCDYVLLRVGSLERDFGRNDERPSKGADAGIFRTCLLNTTGVDTLQQDCGALTRNNTAA